VAAAKRHTIAVHDDDIQVNGDDDEDDGSNVEQESDVEYDDGADHKDGEQLPQITNLTKWMSSQWEEVPKVRFTLLLLCLKRCPCTVFRKKSQSL
jgi:hypothetical protein